MAAENLAYYREFLIVLAAAGLVVPLFLRLGINARGKANTRLLDNRRIAGANRDQVPGNQPGVFEQQRHEPAHLPQRHIPGALKHRCSA